VCQTSRARAQAAGSRDQNAEMAALKVRSQQRKASSVRATGLDHQSETVSKQNLSASPRGVAHADRLREMSPSLCMSLCLCLCLCLLLSVSLCLCLSITVCVSPCLFLCQCLLLSVSLCLCLCPYLCLCLTVCPCLCPYLCLFLCLSVSLSVSLSVALSVCVSHWVWMHLCLGNSNIIIVIMLF
jgi:hypothetical protein